MNKNTIIVIGVVIVVLAGASFVLTRNPKIPAGQEMQNGQPMPTTATEVVPKEGNAVKIENFAFDPPILKVKKGTTVTWTQADTAPHTVTADDGSFSSEQLSKGQTFTFTFNKTGEFSYKCTIHPSMTAKVIVE